MVRVQAGNSVPIQLLLFIAATISIFLPIKNALAKPLSKELKQAHLLLEQEKESAALACLNGLISREPNNALAYGERALLYLRKENFDKALDDIEKAIRLSPKQALAYTTRSEVYIKKGLYQKALEDANKAIELNPRLEKAYSTRGYVYECLSSFQKEIQDYDKAIALNPRSFDNYLCRAYAFRQIGKYQKALQDCNKAIALNSADARLYLERGYINLLLGDTDKSISDYRQVLSRLSPRSSKDFSAHAVAYSRLGQYQNQIVAISNAIRLNHKNSELYNSRALAYYRIGQLQNAVDDSITAIRLNASLVGAYETAALALEELGLYQRAIDFRTKLLELRTRTALDWSNRAKDYECLGKSHYAQADWQKAYQVATPNERTTIQLCNPLRPFADSRGGNLTTDIATLLKGSAASIPFHYDDGGHICVPVILNDRRFEMMLDTGCSHSDLWKKAALSLSKISEPSKSINLGVHGQTYLSEFFVAQHLRLGDLSLLNVPLTVDDGIKGHKILSGFLAGNLLENFVVTVDFANKRLLLASEFKPQDSKKQIVVPMWVRNHCPYCVVKLDGKVDRIAQLDTGCPSNLTCDALIGANLTEKLDFKERFSGPWLGELEIARARLKSLTVGGTNFEQPVFDVYRAEYAPRASGGLVLGTSFLSQFKAVTFNYPGRQLIFELNEKGVKSAQTLYSEGCFYLAHDKVQEAIDSFGRAMVLDADFEKYCRYCRALGFIRLRKYSLALLDLNAVVKLAPSDHLSYWQRGRAYGALRQYDLQIADCSKTISIDKNFQAAYLDRAAAYEALGKHRLAEQDRQLAAAVSKHH